MVAFVPVLEIAKVVAKYKNSILKYNPRCFLSLKNNTINPKIRSTIRNNTSLQLLDNLSNAKNLLLQQAYDGGMFFPVFERFYESGKN